MHAPLRRVLAVSAVVVAATLVVAAANDDQFAYSQVIANCMGQQVVDTQMQRMVSAIRRCEQFPAQPLRDRALETAIRSLQIGNEGRVIYVPVGVGAANLSPLGNPLGNPNFGAVLTQAPAFNPSLFDSFGNQLGNNQFDTANRRPISTIGTATDVNSRANPFGFALGKQQAALKAPPVKPQAGTMRGRAKRQVNLSADTRHQALQYLSNMTCVMRAASVVDHNNLPNYQYFENEARRMQVARELRTDVLSGLLFCKEMTQCMNVDRLRHPLARELGQAVAYMRCVAKTNVKACKKQDQRRSQSSSRLSGGFNLFNGNGMDLLNSIMELTLDDDSLGFDFF